VDGTTDAQHVSCERPVAPRWLRALPHRFLLLLSAHTAEMKRACGSRAYCLRCGVEIRMFFGPRAPHSNAGSDPCQHVQTGDRIPSTSDNGRSSRTHAADERMPRRTPRPSMAGHQSSRQLTSSRRLGFLRARERYTGTCAPETAMS